MLDALNTRYKLVCEEFRNAKSTMDMLTEQLERQKVQVHVITGHQNELAFQINEAQKLSGVCESPQAIEAVSDGTQPEDC